MYQEAIIMKKGHEPMIRKPITDTGIRRADCKSSDVRVEIRPSLPLLQKKGESFCVQRAVKFTEHDKCPADAKDMLVEQTEQTGQTVDGTTKNFYNYRLPNSNDKASAARLSADFLGRLLQNVKPNTDMETARNHGRNLIFPFNVTCVSAVPQMEIVYEVSKQQPGYITSIKFGAAEANRFHLTDKSQNPGGKLQDKQFNTAHDTTNNALIMEIANQGVEQVDPTKTEAEQQETIDNNSIRVDALTKIGAEGARFQCVREHADTIKNNTIFYSDVKQAGVKFCELWSTWKEEFGMKFNISNQDILDAWNRNGNRLKMPRRRERADNLTENVYDQKGAEDIKIDT
ncbi:MAG: hypothetical protein K2G89_03580 [Lachnospiraceae bacterium]|nr:hypothetical protein [Lachnospiraceae bacterium]